MADEDKPKLLRLSDVDPELRRFDKLALDEACVDEDQLESGWEENKAAAEDPPSKGLAITIPAVATISENNKKFKNNVKSSTCQTLSATCGTSTMISTCK